MAVGKSGTENKVILFNLHPAEGQLGFKGQLKKGWLISVIVSLLALKSAEREGLARINKVNTSFLNYFNFLFTWIQEVAGSAVKEVLVPSVRGFRIKVDLEIQL